MNYQKLLEQHKETVYKMILRRKPALYHPPRIEPIPSGNLPAGFNLSTDRSVYIENIHTQVTEPMIHEVFSSIGPVETCKLIRKEKSSYGFIQYHDRRSPALAIFTLNGRHLYGQPLKVNWAYTSAQREDTSEDGKEATNNDAPENSSQFATGSSEDGKEAANNDASENKPQFTTVYVGHLAPEVTQLDLHRHFHNLCVGVIEEVQVHRNKGFGFVSVRGETNQLPREQDQPHFCHLHPQDCRTFQHS